MTKVLVLGGGPDAEREISISSANGVLQGCLDAGLDATLEIVQRPTPRDIESWDCDIVFPVLHGAYGEGGVLQTLLEQAGIAFIGSGFEASRLGMDKMATKLIAARLGIASPAACIFEPCQHESGLPRAELTRCPFELPVVIKPVAEGSSVGLHICLNRAQWIEATQAVDRDIVANPHRVYMIERYAAGRELTASVISDPESRSDLVALPLIEITPKDGVYDYDAKYKRQDTRYIVNPELPERIAKGIQEQALMLCRNLGIRHLARVDFLLSDDGHWTLLETNTMPGFTPSSLLPRAAAAHGLEMPEFCKHLVESAIHDFRGYRRADEKTVTQG